MADATPAAAGELVVDVESFDLTPPVAERTPPSFNRPLTVAAREIRLLNVPPWVRSLGKLGMEVGTEGWRFPVPVTAKISVQGQDGTVRAILQSTVDMTFVGQETTIFRFKLDDKGAVVPGSVNRVHKELRSAWKAKSVTQ